MRDSYVSVFAMRSFAASRCNMMHKVCLTSRGFSVWRWFGFWDLNWNPKLDSTSIQKRMNSCWTFKKRLSQHQVVRHLKLLLSSGSALAFQKFQIVLRCNVISRGPGLMVASRPNINTSLKLHSSFGNVSWSAYTHIHTHTHTHTHTHKQAKQHVHTVQDLSLCSFCSTIQNLSPKVLPANHTDLHGCLCIAKIVHYEWEAFSYQWM